ncbi:SDR family oxidoreductase [Gemmatimonas sp.]|uniref:SDR family oxidoreductase n=1 Tax=Gemmatimonas sp. TaxID=1962908 RepID=UPI00286EB041|nr:SDR family oxidoreductase [Gemmatimonas sp.]
MRVFVTGANGFIGSAIVRELTSAGHDVLGLARSEASARAVEHLGAAVHRGDVTDLASLAAGAQACDGVIHTAFNHDWSIGRDVAAQDDRRAVDAIVSALEGTGKAFVSTSATTVLAGPRTGTEHDMPTPGAAAALRAPSEHAVLEAASRGVRSSVVRLPPSVHGTGDHGFVPILIDVARRAGFAAYVDDGTNQWPAVHRADVARLFRLALDGAAAGSRWHGVGEEGVEMREIARAIGDGLGVPVRSLPARDAEAHFGWFAGFAAIHNPTSSVHTRSSLSWMPHGPGLVEDIGSGGYFA